MIDKEMRRSIRLSGLQGRNLSMGNAQWVTARYSCDLWDDFVLELYCRRKQHHRLVITNHSVRVAQKMLATLDISVFPVAERCTTPYKDAGAWSWMMRGLSSECFGSSESLRECASEKNRLYLARYETIETEPITIVSDASDAVL